MDKAGIEFLFRTFNDPATQTCHPDGIYLFAQTEANKDSVIEAVATSHADRVMLLQTAPRSGYEGFDVWAHALEESGVSTDRIQGVPMAGDVQLNTRTESQALIRHIAQQGLRSIQITAAPFHQLRAFMTVITIVLEENMQLCVTSRPGVAALWQTEVIHSQGTLTATRSELIHAEMDRIKTYQDKGDLASFRQVLNYLDERDRIRMA